MTLPAIQTHHGRFALLEIDNPARLAAGFGLEWEVESNHQVLAEIVASMVKTWSPEASGLVVDPLVGLETLSEKDAACGLLLRLEEVMAETDPLAMPSFTQDWGVEEIGNNFGVVKLELFYHPAEAEALIKKQWLAEMYDYCRYQHLQMLLKLRLFSPQGEKMAADEFQDAQLQAVQEVSRSCDVLALEPPPNALAAATITAETDVPWIVHSGDQPYGLFKESVREAVDNGAQGFLVGETLWPEMYKLRRKDVGVDTEQVQHFITTVGRDRVIELGRIIGEQPQLA
jgi:tagatose-1,6-bisphosphate aldolase